MQKLAEVLNSRMRNREGGQNQRLAIMLGWLTRDKENPVQMNIPKKDRSAFAQKKWNFLLSAPFEVSNRCCGVMKKDPARLYTKQTGRVPITAQMASESRLRFQKWLAHGCNAFDAKKPISNPMSFWTDQDVLQYIRDYNLPICSVYGEVVPEKSKDQCDGQIDMADLGLIKDERKLTTTGCKRTGCVCCGFGCHLEKSPNRFEMLKETHPQMYKILDIAQNNGVTYREAIDWINQNSDEEIKY